MRVWRRRMLLCGHARKYVWLDEWAAANLSRVKLVLAPCAAEHIVYLIGVQDRQDYGST
jgi:hypothetical protein